MKRFHAGEIRGGQDDNKQERKHKDGPREGGFTVRHIPEYEGQLQLQPDRRQDALQLHGGPRRHRGIFERGYLEHPDRMF